MKIRITHTPAEGRNEYGKYTTFRKTPANVCDNTVMVFRECNLRYSSGNKLSPIGYNNAFIEGVFDIKMPETWQTIDTVVVRMTPVTNVPSSQRHYTISGNEIYWNREQFGTTYYSGGTETLYGSYQGVEYSADTVNVQMDGNYRISTRSELGYFMAIQSSTDTGTTEINASSGQSIYSFIASVIRNYTWSSYMVSQEEVTDITHEYDEELFLDTTIGELVGYDTVRISQNPTTMERTGVVELYDDLDINFVARIPVTQAAAGSVTMDYLTFDIISGGTINWKNAYTSSAVATGDSYTRTISYSKNNGETWTDITSSTGGTSFTVNAGDKVLLKGLNASYAGLIGSTGAYFHNTFSGSTATFNALGNIMSLIYGDNFENQTALTESYTFRYMFEKARVVNASSLSLPALQLQEECYEFMFSQCTLLNAAPLLPATTLAELCYRYMFERCTSLIAAPSLPATSLAYGCYEDMFQGCTSLIAAPSLPATALTGNCYGYMFEECTSLTAAPALPATTLTGGGNYAGMFRRCTSLATAPVLPAKTLTPYCYMSMFDNCTSLNHIDCYATDISAQYCLYNWVNGVSATGTFVKDSQMSSWPTGKNGIPSGWTVQDNVGTVYISIGEADLYDGIYDDADLIWDFMWDNPFATPFEHGRARVNMQKGETAFWGSNDYEEIVDPEDYGNTRILYYHLKVVDYYNDSVVYEERRGHVTNVIPTPQPGSSVNLVYYLPNIEITYPYE